MNCGGVVSGVLEGQRRGVAPVHDLRRLPVWHVPRTAAPAQDVGAALGPEPSAAWSTVADLVRARAAPPAPPARSTAVVVECARVRLRRSGRPDRHSRDVPVRSLAHAICLPNRPHGPHGSIRARGGHRKGARAGELTSARPAGVPCSRGAPSSHDIPIRPRGLLARAGFSADSRHRAPHLRRRRPQRLLPRSGAHGPADPSVYRPHVRQLRICDGAVATRPFGRPRRPGHGTRREQASQVRA